MTPFRFDLRPCDLLPKLAWVAEMRRADPAIRVLHGPWVETRDDRFFEGAWDGSFAEGAFDDAVSFLGSGGRLAADRVVFAGPTHKMDRIQSVAVGDSLYVANSLVLLLTRAGEDLDLQYPNYFFDYLNYFRKGISIAVKPIRLRSGNRALLHDCCNIAVSRDLAISRIEKRASPAPSCYREYSDFLEQTARDVTANAADPVRMHRFEPVAAISRGYDSVAVAALASRAGCRKAVTFRQSGNHDLPDGGAEIAAALGMEVTEYNRIDYASLPGLPEAEFYQYAELSAKAQSIFEDRIGGSLFFNGQGGEDYWDRSWRTGSPLLQEPTAFTMSGNNLTEFRLRAGIVVFPLAACGAIHAPAIARLSGAAEMQPWSIGGGYDRPMPRRLAEERGVPRHLFGRSKVGGGPRVGRIGLCPASDADFRKFYQEVIRGAGSSGPHRAERRRRRIDWMRPFRKLIFTTPWLTRFLRGLAGDRFDPRWGTMALFTFHWGFYRVRERYVQALHGCASAKSFTAADCGTRPREMDSFAEIAEGFDLITVTRSTERYTDVIPNVPHGARRVLDVGCGTGVLTERLARDAGLVVGLDVSPSMLALARRRCVEEAVRNVTLVFGSLERPPLADQAFDVVVCTYVLQRAALDRALPALRRLVRPGGRLVIVVLVSSWPRLHDLRVARLWSIAVATPGLLRRHGLQNARRLVAHRIRRTWRGPWGKGLLHTPDGFRSECSRWLPGSRALPPRSGAITVVWDAPA